MVIQSQRHLPECGKQSAVVVRFREPIPKHLAWEFYAIRLTRHMLAVGEASPFRVSVTQPRLARAPRCGGCRGEMRRLDAEHWRCVSPACDSRRVRLIHKPSRGVVQVVVPPAAEVFPGLITLVILILDRRYPEKVLAEVYRTAGTLAEILGVGIR